MKKQVDEIEKWLESSSNYELPAWKSLPTVPLYMEQVTQYINEALAPLTLDDKKTLTSFMVNNYVKAGMIKEPDKKKYGVEHLGYLLAITTLKGTLSMSELSLLIEMDSQVSTDKSVLYGFFRIMNNDIIQDKSKIVKAKIDAYVRNYDKEVAAGNPLADINLRDQVALTAFRLAIQSEVDHMISSMLISALADDLHGPKERALETTPGHKEEERERKISAAESKRLFLAKEAKAKEAEKAEKAAKIASEKAKKEEAAKEAAEKKKKEMASKAKKGKK